MSDLIDRETAYKVLTEYYHHSTDTQHQALREALSRVPSAEKIGKWKPWDLTWGRSIYACTNCGDAMEVPTESGKPMYAFCPNCGARMEG